jgi:heptaprenylglyceryl phosphate synthase
MTAMDGAQLRRAQDLEYEIYNINASLGTVSEILSWGSTKRDLAAVAQFTARYESLMVMYREANRRLTNLMVRGDETQNREV